MRFTALLVFVASCVTAEPQSAVAADGATFQSHPPTRPLPIASQRPLPTGPVFFVDAKRGDDANDGSKNKPWKTVGFACKRLKPGDTLCLRAGVYYEQVTVRQSGTAEKPVTLRGYPGEIAVIDGGFRHFTQQPADAWEPVEGGAPGEFRSVRSYKDIERATGNFGDSMIPLHSYRNADCLRATNEVPLADKPTRETPFYLGPGVWHDTASGRIHVRLAHTHIKAFGKGNYRGEIDPRKLPLVVAGWTSAPLTLQDVRYVRVHDLVIRGGGDNTVLLRGCNHIELDGVTIYVANRGMRVETSGHLRVIRSAFRGTMPPWGSRTASKYRTVDSHLFVPVGTYKIRREEREYLSPQCHDFELAHCEFTDSHDGPYVGGVNRLRFHHNLVDNMNDDGIYLSAWGPPGSDVQIYQNKLSRCLTVFAFGLGRGSESDPGTGTFIYRNIIDLRAPVPYGHPRPEAEELTSFGRLNGDHGGPMWEPIDFYHNTVVMQGPAFRGYYAAGWGGHMRVTGRQVFNNLFVQMQGLPGLNFSSPDSDLKVDGNLHWSLKDGPQQPVGFFDRFRKSNVFAASKKRYPPGWTAHDRFVDPKLLNVSANWRTPLDVQLHASSPAIDAGVKLDDDWADPFRKRDGGRPDIGALPLGATLTEFGPSSNVDRSQRE